MGRVTALERPDGKQRTFRYSGLSVTMFDEKGDQTRLERDGAGNLRRSVAIEPGGREIATEFEYGPFNLLKHVWDPARNLTRLYYDVLGRRTLVFDPDTGWSSTTYNAFGQTTSTSTAAGGFVSYDVDLLGRIEVVHSSLGDSTFEWDTAPNGIGKLAWASGVGPVRTEFVYDSLGRESGRIWTVGRERFAATSSYDEFGRLLTIQYPEVQERRLVTRFGYTLSGDLESIRDDATRVVYWQVGARSNLGQVTRETYGNGVSTERQYDPIGQLRFLTSTAGNATIQRLEYDYDITGNLSDRRDLETRVTEDFRYDHLRRLRVLEYPGEPRIDTIQVRIRRHWQLAVPYRPGRPGPGSEKHLRRRLGPACDRDLTVRPHAQHLRLRP